jgi:hypothetical protein
MRTTVTLDPDVERLVRDVMRERGLSFKQALNEALRRGLAPQGRPRRFVQRSFRMGEGREVRWDRALALAEAMEDEELSRKLARHK